MIARLRDHHLSAAADPANVVVIPHRDYVHCRPYDTTSHLHLGGPTNSSLCLRQAVTQLLTELSPSLHAELQGNGCTCEATSSPASAAAKQQVRPADSHQAHVRHPTIHLARQLLDRASTGRMAAGQIYDKGGHVDCVGVGKSGAQLVRWRRRAESDPSPPALRSPLSPAEREMVLWAHGALPSLPNLLPGEKVDRNGRIRQPSRAGGPTLCLLWG